MIRRAGKDPKDGNLIRRLQRVVAAVREPAQLQRTLLRGGAASLVLSVIHVGCAFLISVVLARMLGADGFGVYSFAYALAMVLAIPAHAGISQLVIRETVRATTVNDWAGVRGLWIWSTRTAAACAIVSSVSLAAGSAFFNANYAVMFGAGLIPFVALASLRGATLTGLHRVVMGQLPERVLRPTGFLFLLLVAPVIFGWGELLPEQAIGLHVMASILAFAAGTILLARFRPTALSASNPAFQTRRWLRAVLPLTLIAGLQLLLNNTDILMLGVLRSNAEVGLYRVVSQCSLLVIFGLQAFNLVVAPQFARLYAEHDYPGLQKLAVTTARVGVVAALPLGAIFAIWGETVLEAFFGLEYVGGYIALLILISGRVLNAALGQVGLLLQMTGNEKYALVGTIFAASLNIILNLLLIPLFGVEGAATATAIALVSSHLLLRRFVRVSTGIESSIVHFRTSSRQKI